MRPAEETLQEALDAFDFGAPVALAERYGEGHVNDTFRVLTRPRQGSAQGFVLQRLSAAAFRHPEQVMHNILAVTEYLAAQVEREGGDRSREVLEVLRPRSGEDFYRDCRGGAWRAFPFIPDAYCCQSARTPQVFAASGRAFGIFQRRMDGFPAQTLYETIPRFHDTADRLEKLKLALDENPLGRADSCRKEAAFALAREWDCPRAVQALERGELPLRVTHNDTKLNNVLLDAATGEGICVIDLDTVMPGSSICDFGDAIRYGANRSGEDERDLSRVGLDLDLFAVYTKAFLEGAGSILTEEEISWLPWGARLMTLECGIRFLTDWLEGDRYFRIRRPGQNLDRARTQFRLVADMEAHWDEMNRIVERCGRR